MSTSNIKIDEGSTTQLPTYDLSEDSATKKLPRTVINTSAGVEAGTSGSPLQVSLANTAANSTAVKVDGSAVTQPISNSSLTTIATNTGNIPASPSTSTKQSDGSQKTQIVDGSGNVIASTSNALNVAVTSGGGGGTQYTDAGATASHPIGTMPVYDNAGTISKVGTSNGLPVQIVAGNPTSITANAGTNLNTSALALETGGNLATTATNTGTVAGAITSSVMQSNTKQINGITPLMGNGVTGTGSQRVTIASDNTAFSVNATLSAETTKVIGTVNQGTSPWIMAGGGTAGSAASGVVTVQGISSMTALKVDGSGVTQPVSGTVTANAGSGTFNIQSNASVNITQVGGSSLALGTATAANSIPVTIPTATLASLQQPTLQSGSTTAVTQATASNLNATVVGQATGSAVPANGFYSSGQARTSLPTAATSGNLTGAMYDKFGRTVTLPNAIRDLVKPMTQLTLTSTTTETSLIAAVASTFNDLVSLVVINTSATATQVDFRDSTAGTIRLSLYVPAGDTRGISLTTPIPQAAVNTAWTAKCVTSVASVIITGTYIANA